MEEFKRRWQASEIKVILRLERLYKEKQSRWNKWVVQEDFVESKSLSNQLSWDPLENGHHTFVQIFSLLSYNWKTLQYILIQCNYKLVENDEVELVIDRVTRSWGPGICIWPT